jgi:hypothetical protein
VTVDECHERLHAAGWSLGEAMFGDRWFVDGTNGENIIQASGLTQKEAWSRAVEQAQSLGMLRNRVVVPGGRF